MPHISEPALKFEQNGGGTANVTYRVDFATPIGNSATNKGIAKGDKEVGNEDLKANNQYLGLSDSFLDPTASIVVQEMNLITRSVASSQLSQSLGLNAVVDEVYAQAPDGSPVGVSAFASGEQAMTTVTDEYGRPVNTITRELDYSDERVQKGLYDLEAVDYLTGQIDRHAGNIFINPHTGSVQGIDNDLCFGAKPLHVAVHDADVGAKAVGQPPLFYHEDTAVAIEQMAPEEFRAILENASAPDGGSRLSKEEVDNAVARLDVMKADILLARADGRVVSQFNQQTFDASVAQHERVAGRRDWNGKQSACGNYVGRCASDLTYAKEASLKPRSVDIIHQPKEAAQPDAYEAGLAEHKAAVQQARYDVLSDPQGEELAAAIEEQQQAAEQVSQCRAEVNSRLMPKNEGLERQLDIARKAYDVRRQNIGNLREIHDQKGTLNKDQAKLVKNMFGFDVKDGDMLTGDQKNQIYATRQRLENNLIQDQRQKEREIRNQHVKAHGNSGELQQANQRLAAAQARLEKAVEADPRVVLAKANEQKYIEVNKLPLAQARLEQARARVEAAKQKLADAHGAVVENARFKGMSAQQRMDAKLEGLSKDLEAAENELQAARASQQPDKVMAAEKKLADVRAAHDAAWFDGGVSVENEKKEMASMPKNVADARKELQAAEAALQQAENALQHLQAQQPQIANNNNASQSVSALQSAPRRDLGPRPAGPAPSPPGAFSVAEQLQNERRKATIRPGASTASLQNNNNNAFVRATPQRPVLERPQGPLPPLPDNQQPGGWKKGSTGDSLRKSGESSPRLQRQNSVGDVSQIPAPDQKPSSPRLGGPVIGGRKH